jgi:hypothetical protein
MAKSIRLSEFALEIGNAGSGLSSGSFWENWFKTQAPGRAMERNLDEHRIWEKAVNLEILAAEEAK